MIANRKYLLAQTVACFVAMICGAFEADSLSGTDGYYKISSAIAQPVYLIGTFCFLVAIILNFKWLKIGAIFALLGAVMCGPLWLRSLIDFPVRCVPSKDYTGFLFSCAFWQIVTVCRSLAVIEVAFLAIWLLVKAKKLLSTTADAE
jgi:hypothetical protein